MVDPQWVDYQQLACLAYFELDVSFSMWYSALLMGWELTLLAHSGIATAWTHLTAPLCHHPSIGSLHLFKLGTSPQMVP